MDWLSEINEFPPFEIKESGLDIPAKEASQAVTKYEKALKNAQNDSLDIAIIELRKLVVLYPEMGQAAILLGCCQMQENQPQEALKNFRKASLATLPVTFATKLESYTKEARNVIEQQMVNPEHKTNKLRYPIESAPEIIDAATSSTRRKVKVASEREKKEVLLGASAPKVKETFIDERISINWVKVGIAAIAVLLATGIGVLVFTYVPRLVNNINKSGNVAETKLEWLLDRLNEKSGENSEIGQILKDYDGTFYPTTAPTQTTGTPTPTLAPVTKAPTVTGTPSGSDKIVIANEALTQAEKLGKTDPKKVMELITKATESLQGIDENTTAEGIADNAGSLMSKANLLIKNVVNAACYPYYRDGKAKMDAKAYSAAAALFKQAYDIYPGYLDGGNAYNLGKAYASAGQTVEANRYFQYVVDHYPGSGVAGWAAARIKPTTAISE